MECFLFPTHPSVEGPVQNVCAGEERRKKVIRRAICLSGSWGQLRFFCRQIEALCWSKGCMLVWLPLCIADWSKKTKKTNKHGKHVFHHFPMIPSVLVIILMWKCLQFWYSSILRSSLLQQLSCALAPSSCSSFSSFLLLLLLWFSRAAALHLQPLYPYRKLLSCGKILTHLLQRSWFQEVHSNAHTLAVVNGSKWCVIFYFPWFLMQALTR